MRARRYVARRVKHAADRGAIGRWYVKDRRNPWQLAKRKLSPTWRTHREAAKAARVLESRWRGGT